MCPGRKMAKDNHDGESEVVPRLEDAQALPTYTLFACVTTQHALIHISSLLRQPKTQEPCGKSTQSNHNSILRRLATSVHTG